MATRTIITSDYTGKDLAKGESAVKVKLTIKAGSEPQRSWELDFSEDDVKEFIASIDEEGRSIINEPEVPEAPTLTSSGKRPRRKSEDVQWFEESEYSREEVAEWGRKNGHEVSAQGPLKKELIRAFREEHESDAA